jgi:hypothetical protein
MPLTTLNSKTEPSTYLLTRRRSSKIFVVKHTSMTGGSKAPCRALARIYYFMRPALPVGVRRHFQKLHLRDRDKLTFPRWPVDCSVDKLLEQLLSMSLRSSGVERIPFIWFWPAGASTCAIMTHDVETKVGKDVCPILMDVDDSFSIKASFQIIPEERYSVSPEFLDSIRQRGFEIVVHDLNHDGHLYRDRKQFLERAAKINCYGKEYGAEGFRAASCRQEPLTNLKKRSFRRKYGRIPVTKVSRIDSVGRSVLSFLSLGEA